MADVALGFFWRVVGILASGFFPDSLWFWLCVWQDGEDKVLCVWQHGHATAPSCSSSSSRCKRSQLETEVEEVEVEMVVLEAEVGEVAEDTVHSNAVPVRVKV